MGLFYLERTEGHVTYHFRAWARPEGWSWTVNIRKDLLIPWEGVEERRSAWTVVHDPEFSLTRDQICDFALEQCKTALDD